MLPILLSLMEAVQRERGLALAKSANMRASPDEPGSQSLPEQQAEVSALWAQLSESSSETVISFPSRFSAALAQSHNDDFYQEYKSEQLAEWYVFNLEQPVQQVLYNYITDSSSLNPSQLSALVHYIAALSYLGQMRDAGLHIYSKAEISPADSQKLRALAAAYLSREKLFSGLADEALRSIVDTFHAQNLEPRRKADEVLRKIKAGYGKGIIADTPLSSWYRLWDDDLRVQYRTLRKAIDSLNQNAAELAQLNAPGQSMDGDIEHQLDAISLFPLFRGLSDSTIRSLLKGARILDLDKNQVFLTQGEPMSRFYLILEGWARTFKNTAEGEEAILQILGKREAIFDVGFINSQIATLSAKTVTKAKVLAISLPMLREVAARNKELSQNLLALTTLRLQKLVAQFEQITLRTAIQRVGWFLVNLYLETGLEGAPLTLPFDKSLIASYLNIKPETFSRVMNNFKNRGFEINKHQVVLPEPGALCEFCDPEMALRCCRAESVNCAPIRIARRAEGK